MIMGDLQIPLGCIWNCSPFGEGIARPLKGRLLPMFGTAWLLILAEPGYLFSSHVLHAELKGRERAISD